MRLNKYLAQCGLGSRRAVESLIVSGQVTINGKVLMDLSHRVADGEEVRVNGKKAALPSQLRYYILNKPLGYLTSRGDPFEKPVIYDLLPPELQSLHYVGRLDFNSRGLILLTDDGDLTHRLLHPKFEVPRTYQVQTETPLMAAERDALRAGVEIEPEVIVRASKVRTFSDGVEITLKEGKNREIRKMLDVFGHKVIDLKRIAFAGVQLGQLPEGSFRALQSDELETLRNQIEKEDA